MAGSHPPGRSYGSVISVASSSVIASCLRSSRTAASAAASSSGLTGTTSTSRAGTGLAQGEGRPAADHPDPPRAPALIVDYYATREPLVERALFVGVQGERLKDTQLDQLCRHYVEASGVGKRKRVTPHTLRHVFASELLHAGANLRQIQELLGHKHLDSTQRYTRVNAHELRGAIKRLRWVG